MDWRYDLRNLTPQQRAIIMKKDEEEKLNKNSSKSFSEIWQVILRRLKPGDSIQNWTVLKGNLGDSMKVVQVDIGEIVVQTPNAMHLQHVSRDEFEKIWEVWPAYKSGQKQRQEIREITFHSKYILSILHWLEKN